MLKCLQVHLLFQRQCQWSLQIISELLESCLKHDLSLLPKLVVCLSQSPLEHFFNHPLDKITGVLVFCVPYCQCKDSHFICGINKLNVQRKIIYSVPWASIHFQNKNLSRNSFFNLFFCSSTSHRIRFLMLDNTG